MMSSGPGAQPQGAIFCFFLVIYTKQKSPSLEPLIGFIAFVVGKLWPKNNRSNLLINYRCMAAHTPINAA